MTGRLIGTGQVVVDVVLQVPALPAPGGDVFAEDWSLLAGGGFNAMAAAARQGIEVVYAGGHGTGPFGELARAALAAENITAVVARRDDLDTGTSVALIDPSAERTFVSTRGAETVLDDDDLRSVRVGAEDYVIVSGYSLLHPRKAPALVRWLTGLPTGTGVAFDPGPLIGDIDPELLDAVLARTTLWSSNHREAAEFVRRDGEPGEAGDAAALAGWLHDRLPAAEVVLRDGDHGCVLIDHGQAVTVPGVPVTAVDTNGAGDTHLGVLLAGLLQGRPLRAAADRANRAAAFSVTRHGPATAPTPAELDAWLAGR